MTTVTPNLVELTDDTSWQQHLEDELEIYVERLIDYFVAFTAAANTLPTENDAKEALKTAREVWETVSQELSANDQ